MNNKVLCPLPFTKIYNNLGSCAYTPCCWAKPWESDDHHISNTLPIDYFSSDRFSNIRKDMLQGEKTELLEKYCNFCWQQEEKFNTSPRLQLNDLIACDVYKNFDKDGKLINNDKRFIQIGINVYGNHCNLECYECIPDNSSSRIAVMNKMNDEEINQYFHHFPHINKIAPISKEHFRNIVNEIVFYGKKIKSIDLVGGEPMLMKDHFYLLDKLIESGNSKNIELNYTSNMTVMTLSKMKKYFDNFCQIRIQWSVDALREKNHWLRYPTNWDQTVKNVEEINNYLIKNGKGLINSTITPSFFSIVSLKETYDWLFLNDYIVIDQTPINTLNNPHFLSPQHLPQRLKEIIAPKIIKLSKPHYDQMMMKRDEKCFDLAIKYANKLDQMRGTDWRKTFPEISQYAK